MIRTCTHCGGCKLELPPLAEPIDADTRLLLEITRETSVPVLVDFWAPWCGPCRMAAPEVAKAAANLAGKAIVLKVNTEDNPNFVVLRNGKVCWQQPGLLGHRQLEQVALGDA